MRRCTNSPLRIIQIACFRLLRPLLDVQQTFQDPGEWAELVQLSIHNLLLKSISKEPVVIVQVNVNLIGSFLNVLYFNDLY